MQLVYKIRRTTDGLFSTGGTVPSFNKKGKTWSHRGHVSSHLSQLSDKQKSHSYKDCEVVAYEIQEIEIETTSALDWTVTDKTKRAKDLQEQRLLEWKKQQKQKEIDLLEKKLRELRK